jgi:hypothetical protein
MTLVIDRVYKSYEAEQAPVRALRGLSLEVAQSEFCAIMGQSGCGKSTLLNLIAGLDQPDEGTIRIGDETITGKDETAAADLRRRHVGLVFQYSSACSGCRPRPRSCRPGCRAGSASAWRSPARWPTSRLCCWPTSRPARWTPKAARRSSSCSAACMRTVRRS